MMQEDGLIMTLFSKLLHNTLETLAKHSWKKKWSWKYTFMDILQLLFTDVLLTDTVTPQITSSGRI